MLISKIPYKVDTTTYYEQIRHLDWPVFFDSCYQSDREKSQYARYDIISADPFVKIYSNLNSIKVCEKNQTFHSNDDGLEIVQNYINKYSRPYSEIPFIGGAIGYCSYEMDEKKIDNYNLPKISMGIYDWALIVDHFLQEAYLVTTNVDEETKKNWSKYIKLLSTSTSDKSQKFIVKSEIEDNSNFEDYRNKFKLVMDYLKEGDCYQINLSKQYKVLVEGDSWQFYKIFRNSNKSRYMAYLDFTDFEILSGSPERFIQVRGNEVNTRPIKGTIGRDKNHDRDKKNALALKESVKDQSENLMIVDLLRNDLSKNCDIGSIKVSRII